jgi:hypothetical protein
MQFQLDKATGVQLNTYIKEHPELLTNIFSEYAAASTNMDEHQAKDTLTDILAKHYRMITKES